MVFGWAFVVDWRDIRFVLFDFVVIVGFLVVGWFLVGFCDGCGWLYIGDFGVVLFLEAGGFGVSLLIVFGVSDLVGWVLEVLFVWIGL